MPFFVHIELAVFVRQQGRHLHAHVVDLEGCKHAVRLPQFGVEVRLVGVNFEVFIRFTEYFCYICIWSKRVFLCVMF